MIEKIISGGQTGVDLAALDAAMACNIPYGGWCPKGKINEKGLIPDKYSLLKPIHGIFKNEKENYDTRTRCNIRDSDATIIIIPKDPIPEEIKDGTLLTIKEVKNQGKPYLIIDLSKEKEESIKDLVYWVTKHSTNNEIKPIKILNIAGPRETSYKGIYQKSLVFLTEALPHITNVYQPKARL